MDYSLHWVDRFIVPWAIAMFKTHNNDSVLTLIYRATDSNVNTLLNKSLNTYDTKQTMFCLSFSSRDRATTPGRYEQFYFNILLLTKHVPYPQKNISRTQSDQTRSGITSADP
jgi:hypothetical protein